LKNLSKILIFLAVVALVWSCSSEKKSEEQLYVEAKQATEKGNSKEAIRIYQGILKLYPESPKSYRALLLGGLVYAQYLKDDKKADAIFKEFSEKYPDGEKLLYSEAQSFSEEGNFASAIKIYEEILKLYPESRYSCKAQFLIGFVYSENLKNYDKAKEIFAEVIKKYPDCDLADDARFMLESMGSDSLPKNLTK
jgi:outer membrane protein assembly factor BamD (BamD/ComL family)